MKIRVGSGFIVSVIRFGFGFGIFVGWIGQTAAGVGIGFAGFGRMTLGFGFGGLTFLIFIGENHFGGKNGGGNADALNVLVSAGLDFCGQNVLIRL